MPRLPDTETNRAMASSVDEILAVLISGRTSEARRMLEVLRKQLPGPVTDGAVVRRKR